MAALPYIQLYVADYLADTAHLNAAQHGAYLLLILNYWQRGKPLDNRNERLANVARMSSEEWQQNRESIAEFFDIDGDTWTHRRIDGDLAAVGSKSTKNSEAGKASAAAKKAKKEQAFNERSTNVEQAFNQAEADTDTEADTEVNQQRASTEFAGGTQAGMVCARLKAECLIPGVNPQHPKLIALLDAGLTPDEFVSAGMDANGKGFGWVLATAEGRRRDAASVTPLPGARASPPGNRRQTLTETRTETLAALTGRNRQHERTTALERDITGESSRVE